MNRKGLKTTVVAFVFLFLLILLVAALVFDKIELDELKTILLIITPVFTIIIGFLSKDVTGTHTVK